jgi:hypothetical protein
MMKTLALLVYLLLACAAHAQNNTSNVTASTTKINFANPNGTPLAPGQTGRATVTFKFNAGPIKLSQTSTQCINLPGGTEYTSECDDTEMDKGCVGTWQAGQQCTTTFSVLADHDDERCDLNAPNVAYPGIGCQGILQIRIPNVPNNGLYSILKIQYGYQYFNPNPTVRITPSNYTFPATEMGTEDPPTMTFEIMNVDDATLTLNNIAVTAGSPAFTITANDCPAQLTSRKSCDVQVSFSPTTVGTNAGTVTISDNDTNPNATKAVNLVGKGTKQAD